MKVIICASSDSHSDQISKSLIESEFRVTKFASTAGLFGGGSTTLMIGLPEEQVPQALDIIRGHFDPSPDPANAKLQATIYVLDTLGFDQI